MLGVPREKIKHSLNILPITKLIKQKLRWFIPDKKEAIRVEIKWLLATGFIKEVYHPEWLANPVLIQKKNKEWRMCVDYTDLNKHCPKDPFGLPQIDKVVDSTTGCELLSFLDFTLAITRYPLRRMTRSRRCSSCLSVRIAIPPCPLDSRTPGWPTKGPSRCA